MWDDVQMGNCVHIVVLFWVDLWCIFSNILSFLEYKSEYCNSVTKADLFILHVYQYKEWKNFDSTHANIFWFFTLISKAWLFFPLIFYNTPPPPQITVCSENVCCNMMYWMKSCIQGNIRPRKRANLRLGKFSCLILFFLKHNSVWLNSRRGRNCLQV